MHKDCNEAQYITIIVRATSIFSYQLGLDHI